MLNRAKNLIRSWERDGRHEGLTRAATYMWVQMHNFHDRLYFGSVLTGLANDTLPDDPESAVAAVARGAFGRAIRPMQVPQELAGLIQLVANRKPQTLVEIGTARGGTLLLLCRFAAPDATIVSIDLPYGRNGGGYPKWKERHYRRFARPGQTLHLLRANSHDPETVKKVNDLLCDAPIHFVLIDADHSYEGAKRDYEIYGALVAENGVIALHDILPNTEDPSIDVERLWYELEATPSITTDTIVNDPEQGAYGIGLVLGRRCQSKLV